MEIKVFGPGCAKCKKTEEIVREAIAEAGVEAQVVKVSDPMEIAKSGVLLTPTVMVDGKPKVVGKVPTKADVLTWVGKNA